MKTPLRFLFLFVLVSGSAFYWNSEERLPAPRTIAQADPSTHTLYLFRHAKSAHDDPKLPDFDRPLAGKGRKEAKEMGNYFREKNIRPDLVIASPSKRTRETWAIVCSITGYDTATVRWDSTLYRCSFEAVLDAIKSVPGERQSVLVLGHNPSITTVSNLLQPEKEFAEVLTCGLVAIDFSINSWSEISNKKGKLAFHKFPD